MDTAVNDDAYVRRVAEDTVTVSRLLPASRERVWDYLTDPQLRRLWLADGPFDLRPGGAIELVFRNSTLTPDDIPAPPHHAVSASEMAMKGEIILCEPPRRLAFLWHMGTETTQVDFALETKGDKTLLTLTHSRVTSRGLMLNIAGGWHTHLDVLVARLEGRPHPGFWRQFTALEPDYAQRIPA